MNPKLKIALSVFFIALIAFFVARAFWPKPSAVKKPGTKIVSVKKKKAAAAQPRTSARLAIILDDWGPNEALVDDAVAIGRPLTLSILPKLPHSRDIAEAAHANGLGVMLHMPMQPKGTRQPLEPHTIRTSMSEAEIVGYLDEALASIPHVKGVNNHQGSAATSDERVMRTVLAHLKKKGYFFVDSHVIATSVAKKIAAEVGIRFASRDIFIDNEATIDAVKAKLAEAQRTALAHGSAVAIGHDKKPTLEAIRQMVPELEKNGVKLVLAKDLVK